MKAYRLAAVIVAGTLAGGAMVVAGGRQAHAAAPDVTTPIPVMVLGTYHMGNPGRDLHNAKIDPVTTPAKQRELAELARRLARFRPTVIAVEQASAAPDLADPGYARFKPADLTTKSNEVVQIGYRVAALTGARVVAIDVQEKPGEPSYFPYEGVMEWAKARPAEQARLDAMQTEIGAFTKQIEAEQATRSATQILAGMNGSGAGGQRAMHRRFYNGLLAFGDRDQQPGAELAGRWYTRNTKIFGKLMQVTRPGDRVLVVYGAGHKEWLSRLASDTPGYALVEASAYLK